MKTQLQALLSILLHDCCDLAQVLDRAYEPGEQTQRIHGRPQSRRRLVSAGSSGQVLVDKAGAVVNSSIRPRSFVVLLAPRTCMIGLCPAPAIREG